MKKHVLSLVLLFLLVGGCKKNDVRQSQLNDDVKGEESIADFPDEVVKKIDKLSSVEISLDDVLLPNGKTVKEYKALQASLRVTPKDNMDLFIKMAARAIALTTRSNYVKEKDEGKLANGYDNPAQPNGLAYVWQGHSDLSRTAPFLGKNGKPTVTCKSNLFGMDCSGMLTSILRAGGLTTDFYTSVQYSSAATFKSILERSNIKDMDVEDLGTKYDGEWETGDIIYGGAGNAVDHVGIILKKADGTLGVFVSNGSPHYTCADNTSSGRGPRTLAMSDYKYTFSGTVGYIRFKLLPKIEAVSPTSVSGNINEYLPDPIKIKAVDGNGDGLKDIKVIFTIKSGGGFVDQTEVTTDQNGFAETKWKLGNQQGDQILEVSANKDDVPLKNSPIVFTAKASSPKLTISIVSGNNQSNAKIETALPNPLVVKVLDDQGNPVNDINVQWSTTDGSVSPTSSKTVDGLAQTTWTLGSTLGTQTVTVNATDGGGKEINGSPLTFTATTVTSLENSIWDVIMTYNLVGSPVDNAVIYLNANNALFYTEPAANGLYDSNGSWYLSDDKITWTFTLGINSAVTYTFTGVLSGNNMSGTFSSNQGTTGQWTATRR